MMPKGVYPRKKKKRAEAVFKRPRQDSGDVKGYIVAALAIIDGDPPQTEFQRGFKAGLLAILEDVYMTREERIKARARNG